MKLGPWNITPRANPFGGCIARRQDGATLAGTFRTLHDVLLASEAAKDGIDPKHARVCCDCGVVGHEDGFRADRDGDVCSRCGGHEYGSAA